MKKALLFSVLPAIFLCATTSAQNLVTVAGNGEFSYGGNGAPAVNSAVFRPTGICSDSLGNLFIADSYNNVIRMINPAGIMFTFAGNGFGAGAGAGGYTGDHGPATGAELSRPQGLVMDRGHNLFIADGGNNVIRKVDTGGIITTYAGTGTAGSGGDGGLATAATLNMPAGLALDDSGNLYISEYTGNVIRKITKSTGIISTIAGTGALGFFGDTGPAISAKFGNPWFLYFDHNKNLFVCDNGNHRIRKIDSTGVINTIAGTGIPGFTGEGGPATSAEIGNPVGITGDTSGNIYFTDYTENIVRRINAAGIINIVAGIGGAPGYSGDGGPATAAHINAPDGITLDREGNIFFCDNLSNVVRRLTPGDTISTAAGNIDSLFCGDGGPATSAMLDSPMSCAFDDSGNIYVADFGNNCIRIVRPSGVISTFAGNALAGPGYSGDGGPALAAKLDHPKAVAVDAAGNVYIADAGNSCIRVVHTSGNISLFAGTPSTPGNGGDGGSALSAQMNNPTGLLVDNTTGDVYFSDAANHRIRVVHTSGNVAAFAGTGTAGSSGDSGSATSAQLISPVGLAMDAVGNIYIADSAAARIRVVHTSGNIATFAGTGTAAYSGDGGPATAASLVGPMGIAVDDSGNVHITDAADARIRVVHTSGNISTYAGTGTPGFNGDGPLGTAQVNKPVGLSKDATGRLYVTDRNNNRVRRFAGPPGGLSVATTNTTGSNVVVYPNPSEGTFTITMPTAITGPVHYIITDLLGQTVKEWNAAANQAQVIQLSVPAGIYLLNACTPNTRKTAKIVIDP